MEYEQIKLEVYLAEPLTTREQEVLQLLVARYSNREIAEHLTLALSTVKWYVKQILGKLGASNRKEAAQRAEVLGLIQRKVIRNNVPAPVASYVGRDSEVLELIDLIHDPKCRLISVTGIGGVGKTSLAIKTARALLEVAPSHFKDGIFFIPLPRRQGSTSIYAAIAAALGFPSSGPEPVLNQLQGYLRAKNMLLILDGNEHIGETVEPVAGLLSAMPGIKILVTTREALNLREEWRFQLEGLDQPDDEVEKPEEYSAVRLFDQRARQVWPQFSLEGNLDEVVRICRLVDGLPLAIELAASWVRTMSCKEIGNEIRRGIAILETSARDVPTRHQSIRAICDQAWKQLSQEQRSVFKRLSVFRGGFNRESAESVASSTIPVMAALVDKSMLKKQADDRYVMHDLMVQFAGEKLAEDGEQNCEVINRYLQYYRHLLKIHEPRWKNEEQLSTFALVNADFDNVINAWQLTMDNGDIEGISQMIASLCEYFDWQGRLQEGIDICHQVRELATRKGEDMQSEKELWDLLLIKTLNWESIFHNQGIDRSRAEIPLSQARELIDLARSDPAELLFEEARFWLQRGKLFKDAGNLQDAEEAFLNCQSLFQMLEDGWGIGASSYWLGVISIIGGEMKAAKSHMGQSVEYFTDQGDLRNIASAKDGLARVLNILGEFDRAEQLDREALDTARELNNLQRVAWILHNLSWTLWDLGKFKEALANTQECTAIGTDLGNDLIVDAGKGLSANCLLHLGKYREALTLAEEAYSPGREGILWEPLIDLVIAEASYALEDFDRALVIFRDSGEHLRNARRSLASIPFTWLSLTGRAMNLQDETIHAWKLALELAIETSFELQTIWVLLISSLHLADRGAYDKATALKEMFSLHPNVANSAWFREMILEPLNSLLEEGLNGRHDHTDIWPQEYTPNEVAKQILEELG